MITLEERLNNQAKTIGRLTVDKEALLDDLCNANKVNEQLELNNIGLREGLAHNAKLLASYPKHLELIDTIQAQQERIKELEAKYEPKATIKLTAAGHPHTYTLENYYNSGWTNETLVAHGLAEHIKEEVKPTAKHFDSNGTEVKVGDTVAITIRDMKTTKEVLEDFIIAMEGFTVPVHVLTNTENVKVVVKGCGECPVRGLCPDYDGK